MWEESQLPGEIPWSVPPTSLHLELNISSTFLLVSGT